MYVFGYGSLMNTQSAAGTIRGLEVDGCIPARLEGHTRTFDVAFPNDGSQPDKSYVGPNGTRPEVVLFANLRVAPGTAAANGVLLPIDEADMARLVERERRYDVVDVTGRVRPYGNRPEPAARTVAFLGRPEFTRLEAVAGGVLATEYLATIAAGVAQWAARCSSFARDFRASTLMPSPAHLMTLQRRTPGPV